MIRTLGQIIDTAIAFIATKIPALSTLEGTVTRDVVIESPANEFNTAYTSINDVQIQQTLTDATVWTSDQLTAYANNIGLTREPGVQSSGTAIFRLRTFSTASSDISVPISTEVSTSPTTLSPDIITFQTTTTRTFLAVNADSYFNPVTGYFELNVPIQATQAGASGNVAVGAIDTIVTSLSGSLLITNTLSTSGGADVETDAVLLSRINTKLVGNNIGTANGILSLINQNASVVDSLMVRPGDIELTRDQFGNAADVVIIGQILQEVTESRTFTADALEYVLSQQPIVAVGDTITGVASSVAFTFIKDTHYSVVFDTTSLTGGTTHAKTKIRFLGGPYPDVGSSFSVLYEVNSLVTSLQSSLDSDDTKIIGTDVEVREAVKVLVKVNASITNLAGYVHADVVTEATTNLSNLLNSKLLGEKVDRSDVITNIQNTPGVDSVDTTTLLIEVKRPTDPAFITVTDILISRTEYARPDVLVIV